MHSSLDGRIIATVGDLTMEKVDAIVNAANSTLLGGGGVDGAIHSAGGRTILDECREIRRSRYPDGLPTGHAVITSAGRLPAKYVVHTVGPIYGRSGNESELLADCYRNSIALADAHSLRSISFPSISTGVYGYPKAEAAIISAKAVAGALEHSALHDVRLIFHSESDLRIFLDHCGL